jgi:hypothetical protein
MRNGNKDWVPTMRPEARSRSKARSLLRRAADRTTPAMQLEQLIEAIADPRVSRKRLGELAGAATSMPPVHWW